jgi:hypothetical protein
VTLSKKQRRSSRKLMQGRRKHRNRQEAAYSEIEHVDATGEKVTQKIPNRPQRRFNARWIRRAPGLVGAERAAQSRKNRMKKARRTLRKIRKDTRKAMRSVQ